LGSASNYYTERRKTKTDEREVASMAILADRGRGVEPVLITEKVSYSLLIHALFNSIARGTRIKIAEQSNRSGCTPMCGILTSQKAGQL
jgi:hypothetical protein